MKPPAKAAHGRALLAQIGGPDDLRRLSAADLPHLAAALRQHLIEAAAVGGGHFSANLGTVELTLALHYALNTPHDRLVWDVGHQAYAHKLLTARLDGLATMRRLGGLAPFLSRAESRYDAFGAGHAGTSLSAAAGMAAAARLKGERRCVVAVIGDGGLTAGMAFEALNHIGALGLDVLVVGNDNDMSISENVGALRNRAAGSLAAAGFDAPHAQRPAEASNDISFATFFAALGFSYHGPVDGHDLDALLAALDTLKDASGARFLHVVTVKGRGYGPAERDPIGWHGVTGFDPAGGVLAPAKAGAPSYSQVFGDWLCEAAALDARVVAITPAMREGSGLVEFARRFPERYFDVGIAEQHAVTLAAGLACEGMRPVVAIYSTFLQRAYDQLIHDVAIQKLPLLFAIDRGGLVGADGATHHGAFDLSYLRCVPELVVMTPSDENECRRMLATGLSLDGPAAVRYPRGSGAGVPIAANPQPLAVGRGRVLRESCASGRDDRIALLAFGTVVQAALQAAGELDATVVDLRFVKPLDRALIERLAATHALLVTIEDNVRIGGAGSGINELLAELGLRVPVLNLGLPDRFVAHGSRAELLAECGLDAAGIVRAVRSCNRSLG